MSYTNGLDDPELYFQTKLYTGNGGTQSITLDGSENMQPDWVWIKNRGATEWHQVHDSVRGVAKYFFPNENGGDNERDPNDQITSFDSNGFSLGAGANDSVNTNSGNYVSWNWKAGTSFSNDASATSVGTIDSTGSVNTTAGFSIISYTGTGSAGTIAHGLGAVPKMIITKKRSASQGWHVQHASLGATKELYLNTNDVAATGSTPWNDTTPTSSVFSVGTSGGTNGSSATYIAYCFADVKGYSKFGGYTGNGNADGTFVYTGFKPAWLIIKKTADVAESWFQYDNKRNAYTGNERYYVLRPDKNSVENTTYGDNWQLDFLSNGFKLRTTAGHLNNGSFIYMCFAESPFTNSNGVPNNAE